MPLSDRHTRARRALERQPEYQQRKAKSVVGREPQFVAAMQSSSTRVRERLESFKPIDSQARVIEVGSGAHGLIFYFDAHHGVGIHPLAVDYARLFPAWQRRVATVASFGERLPFANDAFDIVLCDNVVDHAESPSGIVEELVRVLAPDGLLYLDRKSTRLNSSHGYISYAVFC